MAVQVDPINPVLKAPGTESLKPRYDELLSNFAFKFNLRHYTTVQATLEEDHSNFVVAMNTVGRCRLTLSKPELKARLISALETKM